MAASAIGAAVGGLATGIGSSLLAPSAPDPAPPIMFRGGGLSSRMKNKGRVVVRSEGPRLNAVNKISDLFKAQAGEFGNLRSLLSPGFGRLTDARVSALENRGASRLSNLRENLNRRRVAGSSFGQAQIQSEMLQLDQEIAEAKARSFLEELDLNVQLLEKQYAADVGAINTVLQNLNIEANAAIQLASQVQGALQNNVALQTQLAMQNAQGIGALLGPFGDALSSGIPDFLRGQFPGTFGI